MIALHLMGSPDTELIISSVMHYKLNRICRILLILQKCCFMSYTFSAPILLRLSVKVPKVYSTAVELATQLVGRTESTCAWLNDVFLHWISATPRKARLAKAWICMCTVKAKCA